MTRLNLQQASLLAASGELGPKARRALEERVERDCDALIELERAKSRMAVLSQLPQHELTPLEKARMSASIKKMVYAKLDELELVRRKTDPEHKNRKLGYWRFIYGGLAGLSAAAAVLVVAGTFWSVNEQIEHRRVEAIHQAEQKLRDYLAADSENMTDFAMGRLKTQLQAAETSITTVNDVPGNAAQQLLEHVDTAVPQFFKGVLLEEMPL